MKIGYWKKSLHVIMCCDTVLIGTQRVWLIVGLVVAHTLCYCAFPIDHVLCCSWQVRYILRRNSDRPVRHIGSQTMLTLVSCVCVVSVRVSSS